MYMKIVEITKKQAAQLAMDMLYKPQPSIKSQVQPTKGSSADGRQSNGSEK
ncbi:MAG: hypothetical protein SFU86_23320 [Pirellulaceae bacterium]|nr:hypothetical protein [Pirellulaceae bacterium]